jgi:NAD(P)-dependent dehydrogenase (short-subunit alcohol dehydrogenase family)
MHNSNGSPRSVLITGASTGIGAECALDLDRQGLRVFAGVRKPADGARLRQAASERLTPILLDVTDAEQIRAATATVGAAVGAAGLDGLVNNAGIVIVGPLEIVPLDELRRQLEVSVIGLVAVVQAFLPLLRTARGRIVNIGSGNGYMAPPFFGPYAIAKFALPAIADCLRVELRRWRIAVSTVAPGSVATPIWDKSLATAESMASGVSAERYDLYREDLEAVRATAKHLAEIAIPPQRVAQAVRHALMARRPKTTYVVGADSRAMRIGSRFLPDRLKDLLMRHGLGLK